MILTTTPAIEGHTIREYKGVVFGEVITGVNFLKDFAASIRNFVGGRSGSYESELVEARQKAMDEMAQRARSMGANAVVGIDIDYEVLGADNGMLMVTASGTALAYQVSGDYMRWIGYFFIFMGIKMATDGVLRGLGIMRPFLVANMVNLAIRLSVALICAPRFGIAFVWLAVPAGWLANFLISYVALRRSWPTDKMASIS